VGGCRGWLTRAEAVEIRERVARGEARRSVAASLGVALRTVERVLVRPLPRPRRPPRAATRVSRGPLRGDEQVEIRRRVTAGERYAAVATAVGVSIRSVERVIAEAGGMPPRWKDQSPNRLSMAEREEISRGLQDDESYRQIAARLCRHPATITREVARNGGRHHYRAWRAHRRAWDQARRPKPCKLATSPRLKAAVEMRLEQRWSPQQISAMLPGEFPDEPEMRVSHETIYQSLFIQGRGVLRKELASCLRSGRARRRPHGRAASGQGRITNMVMIAQRPGDVEDRAVPGHWEGDLIRGSTASNSAIGTLVERSTRYVMLMRLGTDHTAEHVRDELTRHIQRLPEHLRRSVTWDQGSEMAQHARFTIDTGVQVYFCDPHSPWQRGSNENTNGLLRQYFPKGTDLSVHDQDHLDAVAAELNGRPRQTLGWMKPSEKLNELLL